MSKLLAMQKVLPSSYTFDAYPVFKSAPSIMKEFTHPCKNPTVSASVSGISTNAEVEFTDYNNQGTIDDLIYEMSVSGTQDETLTFPNPYLMFDSLSLFYDGIEIDPIRSQEEIRCRVSLYFRENIHRIYTENYKSIDETGTTLGGFIVASSGTTYCSISLLPLFPYLRGMHTLNFKKLTINWRYAVNGGSAPTTGKFCVSGSTDNAYPLLTYSSIQLRSIVYKNSQPQLNVVDPKNFKIVVDRFHVVMKNGAFGTADTSYFRFNLRTDFPTNTNCCRGLVLYCESPDLRTAYNDANNGQVWSLPEYLAVEVRLNSEVLFSHKLSTADLVKRRRYINYTQERNWSTPMNASCLASGNIEKFLIPWTYIDFSNIEVFDEHERVLTGIPSSTNLDIDVYCASNVDADNTNMYAGLHFVEVIDKSSGVPIINRNPLN